MTTQKQIWNNIASEWFEFKTSPAQHVKEFLKNKTGNILDLGSGAGRHLMKLSSHEIGARAKDFARQKLFAQSANGREGTGSERNR